jgi:hypothetical protein
MEDNNKKAEKSSSDNKSAKNNEISLFSSIGSTAGVDGTAVTTADKDILITPGTGSTLNQISQLDFKHVRASHPSDVAQPQDSEIKVSLYPYGERKSGDSYDSPVLVIGGTWNGVRYAPSVDYISGSSSVVAPIWIHPRSGKIEATVFSAPASGFNGISILNDEYKFTLKGGTDISNGVFSDLHTVEFLTSSNDYLSTLRFDQSYADDVSYGDFTIYHGNVSAGYRSITFSGGFSTNHQGSWLFSKKQGGTETTELNFVGGSTAQNILSTNASVSPALGDMYYAPTPGTYYSPLTRLAIGSRSSVMVANSASPVPTWLAPGTTGHTLIGSTSGDASWGAVGIVGGGTGVTSNPTLGQTFWGNNASGYTLGVLLGTSPIVISTNATTGQGTVTINASSVNTNNYVVQRDGSGGFAAGAITAASISLTTGTISTAPSSGNDIVNKSYVDAFAQGIDIKASCRVATAATLSAHSFSSGVMTNTATQAALVIDGVTVSTNDRVLVKNEGAGTSLENGIYVVTNTGSISSDWVLTRAADADISAEVTSGLFVFVEEGTVNSDSGWVLSTNNPITINTTALTFTQFAGAGTITAGSGLNSSGTTIAANISLDNTVATNQIRFSGGSGTNNSASAGDAGTSVIFDVKTSGSGTILLEGKADGFELSAGATGRKLTVTGADKIINGAKSTITLGGSGTDGFTLNTNADGFDISAGTTPRTLTITGSGGTLTLGGFVLTVSGANKTIAGTQTTITIGGAGSDNITINSNADGFSISGGTSSRTLTVTSGGNLTLTSGSNNPNVTVPNIASSTMVVNNGGSFTQYGVLFSSVATNGVVLSTGQGSSGQPLIGQGSGNPVFGNVDVGSYVTGTLPVGNGGTGVSTTFTQGSIIFAGGSGLYSQDNANLFWDDSNNTLGVGTTRSGAISGTNPLSRIKGTGASSSTSSFEIVDSSNATIFFARDDGRVGVGNNNPIGTFDVQEDQDADTFIAVINNNSHTASAASLKLYSNAGAYGHIKATSDLFNSPSDWAEALVIEANTLQSGGLWLSAYTNSITLATTATNAINFKLDSVGNIGIGGNPSSRFHISGGATLSSWTTAGAGLRFDAATFTDSSTASSGTVANSAIHVFSQPTIAASNTSVTYTNAATLYIANGPAAGTNVTLGNSYALWVDAGITRLDGSTLIGTLTPGRIVYVGTGGLLQDSSNMTFDGDRISLPTSGSSGGILMGGDVNVYRSAANVLKTDDTLWVAGQLTINADPSTVPGSALRTTKYPNSDIAHYGANFFVWNVNNYSRTVSCAGVICDHYYGATSNVSGGLYGGQFNMAVNSTKNTGTISNVFGGRFTMGWSATSTATGNELAAGSFITSSNAATANVTNMYGIKVLTSITSGFTISALSGVHVTGPTAATGTISSYSGLYIVTPSSATITNHYGIYIEDLGIGTNRYAIYLAGTSGDARQGISWNGDTNLYRSAADVLKTDDSLLVSRALNSGVATLTDGATPALDASLGNTFLLTASGDRTIAVPTNPTSGQKITIAHKASGANRTLALNTGTGGFRFGTDITALTITTSGLTDYIGAIYNAADNKWDVVSYVKGF